jgi:hypothetical protein
MFLPAEVLFKEKLFYFYCLRVHCFSSAATTSSSLCSPFPCSPRALSPLHAHQEGCSSIEDGQEGDEETGSKLDSLAFDETYLKKVKKEGFLPESAAIIFPGDEAVPAPPAGYRVMFFAFLV